ncbi:hypothetical protein PGT21_026203 [Puccinia graminis f. sp. tritici]|uniref:INO80 complex subunit F domain-containing protein n=1 Tax=Puccinia graminis f. sp. tritici TaxID=56615 RepID=A0A5B0M3P9_PUCGR|nr:hypothetical protein PGT21_026203 [Puccinia graminis f. sp. tritici]KAA1132623.1 hypothetical protein PGTUg99_016064 [Puccinia graminis f. sp. tritici]
MESENSQGPSGRRRRRYDVGMPKSKAYSNPLPSMADEQRYGTKCHELRAKIREIERENQNTQLKILQSKKNVSRLRIERSVLYEALATITANAAKAADLNVPPQAQPSTSNPPLSTSNPNPTPSIPSPHNGFHPQNLPPPNRAYNDPAPSSNNSHGQVPNRNFSRSTEPIPMNGITGLLNSSNNNNTNNAHHGPPPPIPHSQYPQNLPLPTQAPSHNPRMSANAHQLAPISADPTASARFSTASDSPTAPNNHFPHHQLGARSMSVSAHHHHHSRYPSPHHHHHHHHHRHPSEHAHSNPASAAVLPSLRPHPPVSQPLSNGNGPALRVEGRAEGEGADEEEDAEEEDGEEEEEEEDEEEEIEGSAKDGSTSIRQVEDEMEIDAECEEEE